MYNRHATHSSDGASLRVSRRSAADARVAGMGATAVQDQAALNLLDGADVRKALAGDQAAFASLYNRYFNRVYDFLARMLRDSAAAEDVTQETFIQAMTALPSLKKPEGFKSWLFTI